MTDRSNFCRRSKTNNVHRSIGSSSLRIRRTISVSSCNSRVEFSNRLVSRRRCNFRSSDAASLPRSVLITVLLEFFVRKLKQGGGCCSVSETKNISNPFDCQHQHPCGAETLLVGQIDFQ